MAVKVDYKRRGTLNELSFKKFENHTGEEVFKGADGKTWKLEKAGKVGGWESGGSLAGTFTSGDRRAFIKRDGVVEPQIAEVLASRLMNNILPGSAAITELVVPNKFCADEVEVEPGWVDVYLASHHHPKHVVVLSDHEKVKEAYGGNFEALMFVTPALRGGVQLEKAYGPTPGLFSLACLHKAIIGDLLIANNDMHLGNMILHGDAPFSVQAFDFGAAFNFDHVQSLNLRVAYDVSVRGAIKTESCNHLFNYPESWTFTSEDFWKEVSILRDFDEKIFGDVFEDLKKYYGSFVLCQFLQTRCMVGLKSRPTEQTADKCLEAYIEQFEACMRSRVRNFQAEAKEQLLVINDARCRIPAFHEAAMEQINAFAQSAGDMLSLTSSSGKKT